MRWLVVCRGGARRRGRRGAAVCRRDRSTVDVARGHDRADRRDGAGSGRDARAGSLRGRRAGIGSPRTAEELHVGDRVVAGKTVVARLRPAPPDLLDPRGQGAGAGRGAGGQRGGEAAARATRERLAADPLRAEQALARIRAARRVEARSPNSRWMTTVAEAHASHRRSRRRTPNWMLDGPRWSPRSRRCSVRGTAAAEIVQVSCARHGLRHRVIQESERDGRHGYAARRDRREPGAGGADRVPVSGRRADRGGRAPQAAFAITVLRPAALAA